MRKRRTRKLRHVVPKMHGNQVNCSCGGMMRLEEYVQFTEPRERFVMWRCNVNGDHMSVPFPFPLDLEIPAA